MTSSTEAVNHINLTTYAFTGRPTPHQVLQFRQQLTSELQQVANPMSPLNGFLFLLFHNQAAYIANAVQENPAYDTPAHPGLLIPAAAQARAEYDRNMNQWSLHQAVKSALKKVIIDSANIYVQSLRHRVHLYRDIEPHQFLTTLETNYGSPSLAALQENQTTMLAPYNPDSNTIETLLQRLRTCQEVAQTGNPISDQNLIFTGLTLLQQTGKQTFLTEIDVWNARPAPDQTWNTFAASFTAAYTRYVSSPDHATTARHTGHGANLATTTVSHGGGTINFDGVAIHYCFTHGGNKSHLGKDCNRPAPNHVPHATFFNMCGGNPRLHDTQRQVYVAPQRNRNQHHDANAQA